MPTIIKGNQRKSKEIEGNRRKSQAIVGITLGGQRDRSASPASELDGYRGHTGPLPCNRTRFSALSKGGVDLRGGSAADEAKSRYKKDTSVVFPY